MKNLLFCIFLLSYLETNAQTFSIEIEGGTVVGLNRFIYTNGISPNFRQYFAPRPSIGISFSKFSKQETAKSYFSMYFGTNGKSVAAIVRKGKGKGYSSKESGNGGNPNLGLRWNYYGKNMRPYSKGLMLGVNIEYIPDRFTALGGIGNIYLDKVIKFNGINPSLQIGIFKGLKLKAHSYLRFALYGNIGLRTTSYWYYRAVVENIKYAAVVKSRGDYVNLSVCYGYWHKKTGSATK